MKTTKQTVTKSPKTTTASEPVTPKMVANLARQLPGRVILVDVDLFGNRFYHRNTDLLLTDTQIETANIAAHQTAAISALYESRVS